jgi:predicted RNase H-like nuclease (RuvC/YqgF family)
MPSSLPASVRATLGEDGANDLVEWLEAYLQERTVRRDERPDQGDPEDRQGGSTLGVYREVLSRLDVLEERVVQMEERFEQVDQRFERLEKRFDQLDQRIDEQGAQFNDRIDSMNDRIDRLQESMRVQTRWTVGTIALFGTIVIVLLAIAEFAP